VSPDRCIRPPPRENFRRSRVPACGRRDESSHRGSMTAMSKQYELRGMPLARGAMGEVWQGRDLRRGRGVAVKFPRVPRGADRGEVTRWFRHECRAMASVHHRGVPTVFDHGTDGDGPYLVMRLVRGSTLSDL